jgi:hypothetical protein
MKSSSLSEPASSAMPQADRDRQQEEVEEDAAGDLHRLAADELLELGERDVRAPEGDRPDDRREDERDPELEARDVAVVRAELRPRDQRDRAAADAVEQRHHLRHRVIFTLRAAGTPTIVPIAMPSAIRPQSPTCL